MKIILFIFLSLGATAQETKIHGFPEFATVTRYIEHNDTSYVLTFKDQQYSLLDIHESVIIDPTQVLNNCNKVLETGEPIKTSEYTIYKVGKKGLSFYVGNSYFYPTLRFFQKTCDKR